MEITIRLAKIAEQTALEALQLRASLMWEEQTQLGTAIRMIKYI